VKEHSEEVESITGTFARVEKARAASIVNKSVIMDHVCSENHVIGWGSVKVSDRESNKSGRLIRNDQRGNMDEKNYPLMIEPRLGQFVTDVR